MNGPSPYDILLGTELDDGWVITERAEQAADETGGRFSFGYWVERASDKGPERAFCKILNFEGALEHENPLVRLGELTDDFRFEVEALEVCGDSGMRRVILALASGTIRDGRLPQGFTSYIVFEQADGSIRGVLDSEARAHDLSVRLQYLHDVALGVKELHSHRIGHQDIKPSNVLVVTPANSFDPRIAKVSDLGRSTREGRPSRQDGFAFPGDPSHQPPEYFYRSIPDGYGPRRLGTDLYQLGSLSAFLLTGARMQALIFEALPEQVRWDHWAGQYELVEPYVRDATVRALDRVEEALPLWIRRDMRSLLNGLCDSDPYRRTGIGRVTGTLGQYSLAKVASKFDLMSKRAHVELARRSA